MNEKEQRIAEAIGAAVHGLSDRDAERVLAFAEGMAQFARITGRTEEERKGA